MVLKHLSLLTRSNLSSVLRCSLAAPHPTLQRQLKAEPHLHPAVSFTALSDACSTSVLKRVNEPSCCTKLRHILWPLHHVLRFVGGWRLLTVEKWIIDSAMVINHCSPTHESVCQGCSRGTAGHRSEVMRWTFEHRGSTWWSSAEQLGFRVASCMLVSQRNCSKGFF